MPHLDESLLDGAARGAEHPDIDKDEIRLEKFISQVLHVLAVRRAEHQRLTAIALKTKHARYRIPCI